MKFVLMILQSIMLFTIRESRVAGCHVDTLQDGNTSRGHKT